MVDTNVLMVANRRAEQASPQCVRACIQLLREIEDDGVIVIDDNWRILREYRATLSPWDQHEVGNRFLRWIWNQRKSPDRCEQVHLTPRGDANNEFEQFPVDPDLRRFDPSDHKFVAVARASAHQPPIVNATDTDWWHYREILERHDVRVEFLCPDLMAD